MLYLGKEHYHHKLEDMLSFRRYLIAVSVFSLMIGGCSSSKYFIEEENLMEAINCFITDTQKYRENSIEVYNVSKFKIKNRTFVSIKTDSFYSDTIANHHFGLNPKTLPLKSALDGCIIRQNEIVCFYNFSEVKNLIKKDNISNEFKKYYSENERADIGGYILTGVFKLKKDKLQFIYFDYTSYVKDFRELCK